MTLLMHHSIYLIPEQECVAHISVTCLKCQFTPTSSAFFIIYKYRLLQPYVRGNDGHSRCVLHPQCPTWVYDFSIYMAGSTCMSVYCTDLHACKCATWYSKLFFTTLTCITQMIILELYWRRMATLLLMRVGH